MTPASVVVEGTLQPDGVTLRLEQKVTLPPGRVTVAVQSFVARGASTMLEALERIHADQKKRGYEPMTEEEMSAEIAQTRHEDEEADARWRVIELQTKSEGTDVPS